MQHTLSERADVYLAAIRQALGEPAPPALLEAATSPAPPDPAAVRSLPLEARLAIVQALAAEINACTRLAELTDVLGDAARWVLGCAHVSLALPEESGNRMCYRMYIAYDEVPRTMQPTSPCILVADGLPGYVLRTGEPQVAADLVTTPYRSSQVEDEWLMQGLVAATILPLWWGGQVIGAVIFAAKGRAALDLAETRLAGSIAVHLAPALSSVLLYRKLEALSLRDELTNLPNRRHLDWRLETDCARAARYASPLSLILIDVDRFHGINARCGHGVGDQILRAVGQLLVTGTRRADLVARVEDDTLAVVLPETDIHAAEAVGEHLRTRVTGARLLAYAPAPCASDVTISVGVAAYTSEMPNAESLLLSAQMALDAAKALGGDCVEVGLTSL
jgi:diguanylate cyclase (GGDEF)-like protein